MSRTAFRATCHHLAFASGRRRRRSEVSQDLADKPLLDDDQSPSVHSRHSCELRCSRRRVRITVHSSPAATYFRKEKGKQPQAAGAALRIRAAM